MVSSSRSSRGYRLPQYSADWPDLKKRVFNPKASLIGSKCVQVKGVMPKSGITPLGHHPAKPGEIIVSKKNANINQMDFHYKYHI